MKSFDNRGSALVEAVMIYPVIIFTAAMLLYIGISLFQLSSGASAAGRALTYASGAIAGNVSSGEAFEDRRLYTGLSEREKEQMISEVYSGIAANIPSGTGMTSVTPDITGGLISSAVIREEKYTEADGLLSFRRRGSVYVSKYIIDEAGLLRNSDHIKELAS